MFCPKCGTQNPDTGKFCRSCGTDLGNVTQALTGQLPMQQPMVDHKGKPVSWERAIAKGFTGLAFIIIACALAVMSGGRAWWYLFLLIPGFTSLGAGVAQFIQLRKAERGIPSYTPTISNPAIGARENAALPPNQTAYVQPESRFKTGDLVPPSVTDSTTRHLEMDSEGQTMALPKK